MRKRINSIYEYFGEKYSEEEIDVMITKLSADDLEILRLRFGEDLKNPVLNTDISKKDYGYFYNVTLPRMEFYLACPTAPAKKVPGRRKKSDSAETGTEVVAGKKTRNQDGVSAKKKESSTVEEVVVNPSITDSRELVEYKSMAPQAVVPVDEDVSIVEEPVVLEEAEEPSVENVVVFEKSGEDAALEGQSRQNGDFSQLSQAEYTTILDLIKSPSFGQLVTSLGSEDAIIASLTLGYFEGKYFSTQSVADFLGVSEERVIDSTKNVLYAYRDSFLGFVNKAIESTGNKPIQYVKKEDEK